MTNRTRMGFVIGFLVVSGCATKNSETSDDVTSTDESSSPSDSSSTWTGGTGGESSTVSDSTASSTSATVSSSSSTTETTTSSSSALDDILAVLDEDVDQAMYLYSASHGWPVLTDEGYLFVSTNYDIVAGDFDGWIGTAMNHASNYNWITISLSTFARYKFTNGSAWESDPWSREYNYDDFGEMSHVLATEAHLERHFRVGNNELADRTVRVWVPTAQIGRTLYMQDGQNLFDPEAMWGGWQLQESVPDGMMIVGIDNTYDRMDEYTHVEDEISGTSYGGLGDEYADFLQDQVRPLIQQWYGEPGPIGVMGSSLGGLISLHIANRYPNEFRFAGSMSGTLGWGSIELHNETMIEKYAAAGHGSTAIYIDSGGNGDCYDSDADGIWDDDPNSSDNYCETIQFRETLAGIGYTFETDLWHWWEPDAEHNEVAWAARVWRPLAIFAELN